MADQWIRLLPYVTCIAGISHTAIAQAQSRLVRGVAVDTASQPVAGVTIQASSSSSVVTDAAGRFTLQVDTGRVTFDVRRIGFLPMRYGLPAGGDTTLRIDLIPVAQQMGAVRVEAKPTDVSGFAERMQASRTGTVRGVFITQDEIEKRSPARTSDLFAGLSNVKAVRIGIHSVLIGRQLVMIRAGRNEQLVPCTINLYVDGARTGSLAARTVFEPGYSVESVDIDALVQPTEIAGIEFYDTPHNAPIDYQGLNGTCGIVLVWTKRGSRR